MVVILSAFWVYYPNGSYEPTIVFLTTVGFLIEFLRRKAPIAGDKEEKSNTFDSEFWPEEGRPVFHSSTTHLTYYDKPNHKAEISNEAEVKKKSIIEYTSFRYRTIRPGRVVTKSSGKLEGRSLGEINFLSKDMYYEDYSEPTEIPYHTGDSFEYLQYRAEGSCFIRIKGMVYDIEYCPWLGSSSEIALTKKPLAESWLNTSSGWLFVESGVIEEYDRIF